MKLYGAQTRLSVLLTGLGNGGVFINKLHFMVISPELYMLKLPVAPVRACFQPNTLLASNIDFVIVSFPSLKRDNHCV